MGFSDNITAIPAKVVSQFGVSSTYTPVLDDPAGFTPVTCNVILEHDVMLQPTGYDAQVVETGSTITALFSDVAEPRSGSTFLIGDNVYRVKRISDNDKTFVILVVVDEGDGWS